MIDSYFGYKSCSDCSKYADDGGYSGKYWYCLNCAERYTETEKTSAWDDACFLKGVIDVRNYLERIKEELDMFSDENMTITVSRKDLENLISAHENLLNNSHIKKKEIER